MTKKEVVDMLEKANVEFDPTLSKTELEKLLQSAQAQTPAAEEAVGEALAEEPEVVELTQPVSSGEFSGRLFGASKVKVLYSEERMHNSRPMIHLVLADGTTSLLSRAELLSGFVE